MASSYDCLRKRNIERNNAMLEALGLHGDAALTASTRAAPERPSKKRRLASRAPVLGSRCSSRLKVAREPAALPGDGAAPSAATSEGPTAASLHHDEWVLGVLSDAVTVADPRGASTSAAAAPSSPSSSRVPCAWSARRKHQHLELSRSGRSVVTTGCAGYGGVLARTADELRFKGAGDCSGVAVVEKGKASGTSEKKGAERAGDRRWSWAVEVLRLGVGGFAVGVALTSATAPLKSLGNRPDCWVLHCTGELRHNRRAAEVSGGSAGSLTFDRGDALTITVTSGGRLLAARGGAEAVDCAVQLPAGRYTLCCQPYMGGAARLLHVSS